jgi:hypothetical protein
LCVLAYASRHGGESHSGDSRTMTTDTGNIYNTVYSITEVCSYVATALRPREGECLESAHAREPLNHSDYGGQVFAEL